MRKETQHYQILDNPLPNITQQCQEATKKFRRLNQIKSKNDFLGWLRSLPFQIRYLAVKVQAPGLAQTIRQALKILQSKSEGLDQKKLTHKSHQKNILDSLVFTSDGRQFFDSICFDFSYIEFPEKLYELLMYSSQNPKKFNPIEDMEQNRKPIQESCQEIKHLKSREELCNALVRILRHEVFFNTCRKQEIHTSDEKNRKKDLSFYWKNMTEEFKHNLLCLKKANLNELLSYLEEKNITISCQQLQKQIAHLLKLQKNQFCNRIFKCKLKKSLASTTDYHGLVYELWKSEYGKSKRRKTKRASNVFYPTIGQISLYRQQMHQHQKSKSRHLIHIQKEASVDSFQTNQTQIFQKLEEKAIRKSFFKDSHLNDFIQNKILKNIVEISDFISKEANSYHKARLIAFERIKFILECYGVPIKIFGSCANGIAIRNSDIDIAIDNSIVNYFSYCDDQKKIKFCLQWLQGVFSNFNCMKDIKFIKNANIPIIKLTLDTSQLFQVDPRFFNFDITPYLNSLNRPHGASQIQLDITVQTQSLDLKCSHLGINTTKRISQWMQQMKPLKYIIIIMKYFLNIADLNSTYKDGINTYGIVVMFVAAIRHLKIQKEESVVVMFEKILKFFIYEFDQKQYGIDLRNKKEVFYRKTQNTEQKQSQFTKADLQILDPQNQGVNMTRKCYKFLFIKNIFLSIHKRCFQDQRKVIISSFLKDKKLSSANTKNQNDLKKQSLQTITNEMQNPFMSLLKQHQDISQQKIKIKVEKIQEDKSQFNNELVESFEGIQLLRTQSIMG